MSTLLIAARASLLTLLCTGVAYPLATTAIAQLLMPAAAAGSLVVDGRGQVVGSELLAQPFHGPAYFHPRPSAAGEAGWDATASSGSNLSTTSSKLRARATAEVASLRAAGGSEAGPVPEELVTTSASGLDPHLSPGAARWQVARVAAARGLLPARVTALVDALVEGRDLGLLGEPRVNVLLLNIALDNQFGPPARSGA